MATYKEIKGTQIESLASDPANPVEGQVWYNSTTAVLKGQILTATAAWSTGAELNTGVQGMAGAGTQTSALSIGGDNGPAVVDLTESYNGTTWTEIGDLNTARNQLGGAGADNTAAIVFGGTSNTTATETFNGTNWSTVNTLNTGRSNTRGAGIKTAALAIGGTVPSNSAAVEKWN